MEDKLWRHVVEHKKAWLIPGAEPAPQSWGWGKLKKKKFWEAKIRKNNKLWSKILIFLIFSFFGRTFGPLKPQGGSAP